MRLSLAFVLFGAALTAAQSLGGNGFGNNFGNGFGNTFGALPFHSQSNIFSNKQDERFNNAAGNAAGAGQAQSGGVGSSSSINQANQEASNGNTRSQGLSANTATGTMGSSAGGAAQAGGQTQSGKRFQHNTGQQSVIQQGRRKRNVYGAGFVPVGYGFGGNSIANANAVGGGSAMFGDIATNNRAYTNTGPFGASSFGNSNAMGTGYGTNIFGATNTDAGSGVFGR
ncbi:hypothetical protein RvY_03855 [Ramazzottius varieornatus]|uniref:Uncharacterized protein n=1 Tax=Ramazzottius varieornatus TaxID=947166 RepID=A0A1D1UPJ0_RAMVA|nr:hypothetical protein RvY_03855 [Ramazzottius varieornatus]